MPVSIVLSKIIVVNCCQCLYLHCLYWAAGRSYFYVFVYQIRNIALPCVLTAFSALTRLMKYCMRCLSVDISRNISFAIFLSALPALKVEPLVTWYIKFFIFEQVWMPLGKNSILFDDKFAQISNYPYNALPQHWFQFVSGLHFRISSTVFHLEYIDVAVRKWHYLDKRTRILNSLQADWRMKTTLQCRHLKIQFLSVQILVCLLRALLVSLLPTVFLLQDD